MSIWSVCCDKERKKKDFSLVDAYFSRNLFYDTLTINQIKINNAVLLCCTGIIDTTTIDL